MPFYETVFIVRQDASTQQVENLANQFAAVIGERGGRLGKRESWGLRTLAYRIKKNRKGYYTFFNIEAPPDAIIEIERQMRINEDVLRYLTVRVDKLNEQPSPILQSRGGREGERDRERGKFGRERESGGRFSRERGGRDRSSERGSDRGEVSGAGGDRLSEGGI
ncbi:SSU ribosomal protein S6p [invertebrate metagenome]|uniref:SSU ribosomal protein S6p n=1 Tax=invertebrate metagenome TaxID=1711999 RepID=A0A484H623_9ZZZZ